MTELALDAELYFFVSAGLSFVSFGVLTKDFMGFCELTEGFVSSQNFYQQTDARVE